jgi:hypothetical protein
MAKVTLEVQASSLAGFEPDEEAVAIGDTGAEFENDGETLLEVVAVTACTLTVVTPREIEDLAVEDKAYVMTLAERRIIGPFPTKTFNDSGGLVQITSTQEDTTLVAFKKG